VFLAIPLQRYSRSTVLQIIERNRRLPNIGSTNSGIYTKEPFILQRGFYGNNRNGLWEAAKQSGSSASESKTESNIPKKDEIQAVQSASIVAKTQTWLKNLPTAIKEGAKHYWVGSKLLYLETRTTIGIVRRILGGHTMTRRERRQLVRTFSDMLRMIPFAVILIVPFMEFSLPVLLKLFPNMLPSTFEDKLKKVRDHE
jgi:LETM1 and EF-hand domain-containing protein 1